jgi:integrase
MVICVVNAGGIPGAAMAYALHTGRIAVRHRDSSSITAGRLFRQITKCAQVTGQGFSAQAVYDIVLEHARNVDPDVRPHDLRRTFARLAHEGHAPIEQLSMTLGHASIATTERYIAAKQHFRLAPCDLLNLDIASSGCPTAPAKITQE